MNNQQGQTISQAIAKLRQFDCTPLNKANYKPQDFTAEELASSGMDKFIADTINNFKAFNKIKFYLVVASVIFLACIYLFFFAPAAWPVVMEYINAGQGNPSLFLRKLIAHTGGSLNILLYGIPTALLMLHLNFKADETISEKLRWYALAKTNNCKFNINEFRIKDEETAPYLTNRGDYYNRYLFNMIQLTNDVQFGQFHYQYTTGNGKTRQTHHCYRGFISARTIKSTTNRICVIEKDGVLENSFLNLPLRLKKIRLEGNFHDRFKVYADSDNSEVHRILTPDVMATILDYGHDLFIEIYGSQIFITTRTAEVNKSEIMKAFLINTSVIIEQINQQMD